MIAYLLAAAVGLGATSLAASELGKQQPVAAQRLRLVPKFRPGLTLRYQLDWRTATDGATSGVIENPQAAREVETSVSVILRLDVLSVTPEASRPNSPGRVRLRATYEKLVPVTRADVYDPQLAENEEQLRKLEGRSLTLEFDADGKLAEVESPEDLFPGVRTAATEWLEQLAGSQFPREGIVPGQKWSSSQPRVAGAPLAGLGWMAESTYLRNESCLAAIPANPEKTERPLAPEMCAVIFTRFQLTQRAAPRDPTPEEYRRRGLRTAGKMSGSGESLSYVSLVTGWVVSATQQGTEEMDFTVSTADRESSVRYAGRVRTQSQLTLLPEAPSSN